MLDGEISRAMVSMGGMGAPAYPHGVSPSSPNLAEHARAVLAPLLGEHTARRAVKLACTKLDMDVQELRAEDARALVIELVPMLRTLLGRNAAERVRDRILAYGGVS